MVKSLNSSQLHVEKRCPRVSGIKFRVYIYKKTAKIIGLNFKDLVFVLYSTEYKLKNHLILFFCMLYSILTILELAFLLYFDLLNLISRVS